MRHFREYNYFNFEDANKDPFWFFLRKIKVHWSKDNTFHNCSHESNSSQEAGQYEIRLEQGCSFAQLISQGN